MNFDSQLFVAACLTVTGYEYVYSPTNGNIHAINNTKTGQKCAKVTRH